MTERRGYLLGIYTLCLLACFSTWLIAIRTPLWLDETVSYWQMYKGPSQFWPRAYASFPAYSSILWFFTKIFGTSEIALRVPSILGMLGAVYLLYRSASELLDRDLAMIASVLFSLHPVVVFAAIDARPYAFAALAINAAIYLLVRLRRSNSMWLAAAFGVIAAMIVWFQFLFSVILPSLVLGFFAVKLGGEELREDRRTMWRQFGMALGAFGIAFLPLVPGILYMFRSRGDHPFDLAPRFIDLLWTLTPGWLPKIIGVTGLAASVAAVWTTSPSTSGPRSSQTLRTLSAVLAVVLVFACLHLETTIVPTDFRVMLTLAACAVVGLATWLTRRRGLPNYFQKWRVILCAVLGLIPILILYTVSQETPLHVFVERYRIVAVPGIVLTWALLLSGVRFRFLQTAFCLTMAALTTYDAFRSPQSRRHGYTWKYALEAVEKNAAMDNATVLICSDLPESDHLPLPVGNQVKDSDLFTQVSYYRLTVPVVGLPRSLNTEALHISSTFLQEAMQHHARFLAMGYVPSNRTLEWLKANVGANYKIRELGLYDNVRVLEFEPKAGPFNGIGNQ